MRLEDIRKKLRDPLSEWERERSTGVPCEICKGIPGPVEMASYRRRDCTGVAWPMCRKHALQHAATAPDGVPWTGPPRGARGERCACQAPSHGRFRVSTNRTKIFNTIEYCDGDIVPLCQRCFGMLTAKGVRLYRAHGQRSKRIPAI